MPEKDSQGIWIFAEQKEGKIKSVTLELLGKAREFADRKGVKLSAVLLGDEVSNLARDLIYYGADDVMLVEHPVLTPYRTIPYAQVLAALAQEYTPSVLLMGATAQGRDLAPRVMAKLQTGLTADCLDLQMDDQGILVQIKPSYGGNIMCKIICPDRRPQMATVRPRVFPLPQRDEKRQGQIIRKQIEVADDAALRIIKTAEIESKGPGIEEAEVIVAGGRGLEKKEDLQLLEELAGVLGGVVGGSRPLVDEGWLSAECQIGQSGKTVKPKLMIACGISGAVQFTAGMRGADFIVAINKDPDASIFGIADCGIVGRVEDVLPELIKKFRENLA